MGSGAASSLSSLDNTVLMLAVYYSYDAAKVPFIIEGRLYFYHFKILFLKSRVIQFYWCGRDQCFWSNLKKSSIGSVMLFR